MRQTHPPSGRGLLCAYAPCYVVITNYKMKIRKIFSLEWCICTHEARMTHTNTFITEKTLSKSIYQIHIYIYIYFFFWVKTL